VDEIQTMQFDASGESLRTLRKFVDRFANVEITKLKENDPKKAERIFRRFLEHGSEVICAAGVVDPVATVSTVAMQINYPLLQKAPCPELQERCSALIEAIQSLPSIFKKHVGPVEDLLSSRRDAALEAVAAAQAGPLHIILLMPDLSITVQQGDSEVPGVRDAEIDMPPGSSVGDLRAAGLQVFGRAVARLFCGGRFLGNDKLPLVRIPELVSGAPVQCLPSNKVLPPKEGSASSLPTTVRGTSTTSQEAAPPVNPHALPVGAVEAAAVAAAGRRRKEKLLCTGDSAIDAGKPTGTYPERLAEKQQEGIQGEAKTATAAKEAAVVEKTSDDEEEEQEDEDDDGFFDDFFDTSKKATDAKAAKEKQDVAKSEAEERRKREELVALEATRREQEKAQRKETQEKGLSAMERRLQAQKQAAETKKKLEAERKKASEARTKAKEKRKENIDADKKVTNVIPGQQKVDLLASVRKKAEDTLRHDLVVVKEDLPDQVLSRLRTAWDASWEHSCAGGRRADGSAIFCYPCNDWIPMNESFGHRGFEQHCEKVGHYGWID